ncbi:hypothetical protein V6N13_077469 [Hibiscus sabdariffa]|uniref:Uncharacterized protein n=1 Tax=Hibiscus sabdariffa TaxID=183260 RepID=A0ABR2CPN1_9ROSI
MLPSNGNGCCSDPMAHFATDPSLAFFNFPSPYYNQCEIEALQDYDVFLQQNRDLLLHDKTLMAADSVSADTFVNVPGSSKNEENYSGMDCSTTKRSNDATEVVQRTPGKRSSTSKRDRHSKINTANGPRDRRMRLSLDVAREFFGLQDMLGYDKASRTVEWLLIQARQEIKRLETAHVSKMNNTVTVVAASAAAKSSSSTSDGESLSAAEPKATDKKVKQHPKTTSHPVARDLRDKARARAKERTKAKKMRTQTPWGSTGEETGNTIDESLAITNKWSPNSMLNCLQNPGISQEHQLTGFLPFGKPWETYNNNNL